ncbi:MAG: FAD-dependent oxidoreductase, partial [Acidobacteriota bacterium]
MADRRVVNSAGKAVEEASIKEFQGSLRGELLRPGDNGYDADRKVFNAMIDKRPALIAHCSGAADAIACVNFAREHEVLVSVRGAGHNVAGWSLCDGGLVIDLSRMKGVWINPAARTVRVEPGVTWGEVNHDLQTFGLAATGGFIGTTGVSGLTLGGGLGWLVRKHGLAL